MKNKALLIIGIIILSSILFLYNCPHRSGRTVRKNMVVRETVRRSNHSTSNGKSVVKMRKEYGVYYVPCKINNVEMEFIFDTGASNVVISLTEALFLYKQHKLSDDDILDSEYFQVADGSIAEGTVVNLRSVTIGDKTIYNVKASVVHNMEAPLLLGQTALSEFGRISIDYTKNEIVFE